MWKNKNDRSEGYIDPDDIFYEILEKLPGLESPDAKLIMGALYETRYKIHDHTRRVTKKRPLATVAFHPAEEINKRSGIQLRFRRYLTGGLRELTGLSLLEWLSLPPDLFRMLEEEVDSYLKQKADALKKAKDENDLGKSVQKK